MLIRSFIAVLALVQLCGCATNAITGRSQFMLVSEKSAISQSALAYDQMIGKLDKEGKLKDDPALQQRLDRITGKLVAQAIRYRPETRDWAWSVKLIDEPQVINAFCMAGGKMAVYSGLIEKIQPSDDELAQVMGHEIGHALANHSAEKMSVAMASQLGVAVIAAMGNNSRERATRESVGGLAAALIITLPNSRGAETEADHIGLELAARAGYDPAAAVSLWHKMMAKSGSSGRADFMSTHPSSIKRIEDLQARAALVRPFYLSTEPRPYFELASGALGADSPAALALVSSAAAGSEPLVLNSPAFDRFRKGEVVLGCSGPCAVGFALKRHAWKSLHDGAQWRTLALQVVESDYDLDLSYLYLARAAQALGFEDSARTYLERAISASADEATRCKGRFMDWCDGIALPDVAQAVLQEATRRPTEAGPQ